MAGGCEGRRDSCVWGVMAVGARGEGEKAEGGAVGERTWCGGTLRRKACTPRKVTSRTRGSRSSLSPTHFCSASSLNCAATWCG